MVLPGWGGDSALAGIVLSLSSLFLYPLILSLLSLSLSLTWSIGWERGPVGLGRRSPGALAGEAGGRVLSAGADAGHGGGGCGVAS
jgi:hypothetical protein